MGVFVDSGFASNPDYSSRIGFIIVLMDEQYIMNIVHYGSCKSERVTRSVLAAELFSLVHGFDVASVHRQAVRNILGRTIPLNTFTDSRSPYDFMTKTGRTLEKRLLIDLSMPRQSYERREISDVLWIPSLQNPADSFTKYQPPTASATLIKTNHLSLTPNEWVERKNPSWANTTKKDSLQCKSDNA